MLIIKIIGSISMIIMAVCHFDHMKELNASYEAQYVNKETDE